MVNIGANITKLREAKGVSLVQLADQVGLNRSSLSMCEHGRTSISIEKLNKIAQCLEIPLICFVDNGEATQEICGRCKPLTEEEKELVKDFIDFLLYKRGRYAKASASKNKKPKQRGLVARIPRLLKG